MKTKFVIVFCSWCLFHISSFSQTSKTDQFWQTFNNYKIKDSLRFMAIDEMIWKEFLFTNPDSALSLAKEHYRFASSKKNKKQMAFALNTQSVANKFLGHQLESIANIQYALSLHKEIGYKKGMATCLLNLGNNYLDNQEYLVARSMYEQSLQLQVEMNNLKSQALCKNNIGLTYYNLEDYNQAKIFFEKSIDLYRISDDSTQIFYPIHNLGALFLDQKKFIQAEIQFKEAGRICQLQGDILNEAIALSGLSETYRGMNKLPLSISTGEKSLAMLQELNATIELKETADELYLSYLSAQNYKKALEMQTLSIELTKTLNEEDVKKELVRQEYQFKYEKKSLADSLQNLQKQKINEKEFEAKISRQKMIIGFSLAALLLVLFAVYSLVRSNRLQKKSKEELEVKNDLISEHNKKMLDSITYANYLQSAILPAQETIFEGFLDSFVLFKPKDVVSGDFYWFQDYGAARVLAVADCTGHGVPGALMSMMGYEVLNNVMSQKEVQSPAIALEALDEKIRQNLNKKGNKGDLQDGMDISVLVYQPVINRVQLSGAGNPIVQIRDGELIVHKLDRQGVGGNVKRKNPYQMLEIDLVENDLFYLFTDGFQDQFGGPKGKKMMRKLLYETLLENHSLPFENQKEALIHQLKSWTGNLEQVDDVCVIGVKLTNNNLTHI